MTEGCARGRELSVFHMGRIGVGPKARPPPLFLDAKTLKELEGLPGGRAWAAGAEEPCQIHERLLHIGILSQELI